MCQVVVPKERPYLKPKGMKEGAILVVLEPLGQLLFPNEATIALGETSAVDPLEYSTREITMHHRP